MTDTRILRLNLKAEWFEKIESGEKTQEYRTIKDYWKKRLENKSFDFIVFVFGYTKRTMTFKYNGLHIGKGKPEWGADPDKDYFIIEIGERIK